VPLNFVAVRLAQSLTHPRVLSSTANLPGEFGVTFLVCLLGVALLFATLWKYEMASKHAAEQLRALRCRLSEAEVTNPPPPRAVPAGVGGPVS
jgi:heme exporter protein C